jgi:hypothetical protein
MSALRGDAPALHSEWECHHAAPLNQGRADSRSAFPSEMPKMKTELAEGQEALNNFEQLASTVLQTPRPESSENPKTKPPSRKSKISDKD